jgi:hypothetical protein
LNNRAYRLIPVEQILFQFRIVNIVDGADGVKDKGFPPEGHVGDPVLTPEGWPF